jgi:hypothetical protein
MVSTAMPNTTADTALRRIEPSARARCSRRSVPASCITTGAAPARAEAAAVARRKRMAGATGSAAGSKAIRPNAPS